LRQQIRKTEDSRFKNVQRGRGKIKGHHPANNHLPTSTESCLQQVREGMIFDNFTYKEKVQGITQKVVQQKGVIF